MSCGVSRAGVLAPGPCGDWGYRAARERVAQQASKAGPWGWGWVIMWVAGYAWLVHQLHPLIPNIMPTHLISLPQIQLVI